jgi:hypothetical protein
MLAQPHRLSIRSFEPGLVWPAANFEPAADIERAVHFLIQLGMAFNRCEYGSMGASPTVC